MRIIKINNTNLAYFNDSVINFYIELQILDVEFRNRGVDKLHN